MTAGFLVWVADALVLLAVALTTVGVIGVYRLDGLYLKLHAASKAAAFAVVALTAATVTTEDAATIVRAALIAIFLLLTTPIAAHAIARAAGLRGEPLGGRDPVDETDGRLVEEIDQPS